MAKKRVVHYLNNFFGGIGGEDHADIPPQVQEKVIGPGLALQAALGDEYEIVATVICGDSYFGANLEDATATICSMVKEYAPDAFVAGPAFNAGRYGVACGTVALAVEKDLAVPVITAMYPEIRAWTCSAKICISSRQIFLLQVCVRRFPQWPGC